MSNITMHLALELKLEEKQSYPDTMRTCVGLTIGFSMSKNQISKVGFATLPNNKLLGGGNPSRPTVTKIYLSLK
jgi:hypothetical protein